MNQQYDDKVEHILKALKEIEYGSVLITIHNSKITQIDRTEKKRLTKEQ